MKQLQVLAERSVLGSCIAKPERIGWVGLTEAHFGKPQHARIWSALSALHGRGVPITDVTLFAEVGDLLSPSDIGEVLLAPSAPDEAIVAHVELLDDALTIRNIAEAMGTIGHYIEQGQTGQDVLSKFAELLSECEPRMRKAGVTLADAIRTEMRAIVEDIDRIHRAGGVAGVTSGLGVLDDLVGGIPYRLPTILAARPGMGKSALALHIAKAAATAGEAVIVYTYEDGEPDYARRAMASESGVEPRLIRSRKLQRSDLAALVEKSSNIARLDAFERIEIVRAHGMSAREIVRHARASRSKNDVKLIIVDYLQRMPKLNWQQKKHEAIGDNLQILADFVGADDLAGLFLSQINRTGKDGPTLEDLKGSGDIEEIGKLIIALHDPDEGNRLDVKILKNSFGPPASFFLHFDRAKMRISDWVKNVDEGAF